MSLKESIQQKAAESHQETVAVRRHLHMHPELSFHEYKTAEIVQQQLKQAGVNFKSGVAGTGVVA